MSPDQVFTPLTPLAQSSWKVFPSAMARPRIYPSAPGELISGVVSAETRDRVVELSNERGVSQSSVVRELVSRGLAELDAEDEDGQ